MAKIQIQQVRDFTGGLNLRENQFQLGDNESPDLLNVDVDARGGFRLRGGVTPVGGTLSADVLTMTMFEQNGVAAKLIISDGTNVRRRNVDAWTSITTMSGAVRFTTFKDRLYMQNGVSSAQRYNGSGIVTLGTDWNNNLASPTASASTGDMPIGSVTAAHMGSLWVANTLEGGTAYPSRVRWSHPNFPEDFNEAHYIDVDEGVDGDHITALVPAGDHLLVFKQRSVHAIYGAPPEELQVAPVAPGIGAVSQDAVVATDSGVYFFSWPDGLFVYNGKNVQWLFENLSPAIRDGRIDDPDEVRLGYGDRRVWVAVPWEGSGTRNRAFVFDPSVSKQGSWTVYDLAVGPFVTWIPSTGDHELYANHVGGDHVIAVDQESLAVDNFGASDTHIESYYVTPWYDLGEHGFKKRWKRPEIALRGGTNGTITVEGYKEYDRRSASRLFTLVSTADEETGLWGENWGTMVWAGQGGVRNEIKRGSQLGNARSVAMKFVGPSANVDWGVDAIALKYIPRKVRN